MASILSSNSSSSSSSNSYVDFLQQAKRNFWESNAHLTEDERNHAWFQLACQPTQASTADQIPRSMPCPSSDVTHFSMSGSAPVMNRSDSAMNDNLHDASMGAYTDYTLYSDSSMHRQPQLQSLASIAEYSVDDYVSSCLQPDGLSSTTSSTSLPFPQHSQPMQLTPTPQWSSSSDVSSPASTALMTPVTQSSNMSRQGSCNPQFFDQVSMLRVPSDSSCIMPILPEDGTFPYSFDVESKPISESAGVSPFLSFTGSSSEAFLSSSSSASLSCSVPASVPALASSDINVNNNNNNDQSCLAEDMRRSTSAASSVANSSEGPASPSTNSRHSQREREIIAQAASRKIAPKAIDSHDETESASSNAQMTRIRSEDGSSKTVGVIAKTPYVRPQHPKIKCNFCNERPDGFRGTHELDRHIARAHASRRKGYICVDSSPDQKFLANCKHCRNKKVYGAYYNAAAHLRRAHFHPRKRGRKGRSDEKRGGIGGGDHPPMEYLKQNWIKEVEVENKPAPPQSPESNSDNDVPESTTITTDNNNNSAANTTAATTPSYTVDATVAQYPSCSQQQPLPMPLINAVPVVVDHIQPQYMDYAMSTMHASEPMVFDNSSFFDPSLAAAAPVAPADMSNFQFDAYMGA